MSWTYTLSLTRPVFSFQLQMNFKYRKMKHFAWKAMRAVCGLPRGDVDGGNVTSVSCTELRDLLALSRCLCVHHRVPRGPLRLLLPVSGQLVPVQRSYLIHKSLLPRCFNYRQAGLCAQRPLSCTTLGHLLCSPRGGPAYSILCF